MTKTPPPQTEQYRAELLNVVSNALHNRPDHRARLTSDAIAKIQAEIIDGILPILTTSNRELLEQSIKNLRGTYRSVVKQGLAGPMKWEIGDTIDKLEAELKRLGNL